MTVNDSKVCGGLPAAGFPSPRMSMKRAQAVVNSSLGVLSHYDSYFVRKVMDYKSGLSEFGRFSNDGLRFYPDALSWRLFRRCNLTGEDQ